jgi:DegV family protein with EDD domain
MRIKITSDSTCDLPKELIAKHDIHIFPLTIIKAGQGYLDGVEIQPKDIFEYVESGAGVTQTSAVSVGEFLDKFEELSKEYDAVIHVSISSDFSACYQNAVLAAEGFGNVYVVDSRNLSSGIGHVVLDAAELAESGLAAEDIVQRLNDLTARIEASFVIDTLKYLHRGGRCTSLQALGANMLKLKPCIEVIGGKMDVGKKYRGNFDKVILQYVSDRLAGREDIEYRRIFITHPPGLDQKIVEAVAAAVKAAGPFETVIESYAGCTICHHCGPVCLGVLFIRK